MAKWSNKPVVLEPISFDGDSVVFTAKRLLVEDMQTMSKFFNKERGAMVFNSPLEVCTLAAEIFPKYIVELQGLTKDDGTAVTRDEFLEAAKEFYFVPLISALFAGLMQISTVRSSEKNSAPPSPESSVA